MPWGLGVDHEVHGMSTENDDSHKLKKLQTSPERGCPGRLYSSLRECLDFMHFLGRQVFAVTMQLVVFVAILTGSELPI